MNWKISVLVSHFIHALVHNGPWTGTNTDHDQHEPEFAPEVTEEGIAIVENIFRKWVSNQQDQDDDDDIIMGEELSPARQLEEIRKHVQNFRPQIESNAWLQSVIASL
jgi:DNA mismatch repair protein MSH2